MGLDMPVPTSHARSEVKLDLPPHAVHSFVVPD